jgi:hypothetical protein
MSDSVASCKGNREKLVYASLYGINDTLYYKIIKVYVRQIGVFFRPLDCAVNLLGEIEASEQRFHAISLVVGFKQSVHQSLVDKAVA